MKYFLSFCIIFGLFGLVGTRSFGYFEDQMYCLLAQDSVKVSLKKDDGFKCKKYIRSIEVSMKKIYRDVLTVQNYIDKKQDLGYRNEIKKQKISQINALQTARINMLHSMKKFETNLLETSKSYFLNSIRTYRSQLDKTLLKLKKTTTSSNKYVLLIQQQLDTIQSIQDATSIDSLNVSLKKYLYLKQQITGK